MVLAALGRGGRAHPEARSERDQIAYSAKANDGILVRLERSARRVGVYRAIRTLRLPRTGGAIAVERLVLDAPDAPLPADRPLTPDDERELLDLVRRRVR